MTSTLTSNHLNGMSVIKRAPDVIFIRIPEALQVLACGDGICSCSYCLAHPDKPAMWDTLAIPTKFCRHNDTTYTVHMPDPKAINPLLK